MENRESIQQSTASLAPIPEIEDTLSSSERQDQNPSVTDTRKGEIGRPVRAVSIGFAPDPGLERIAELVDREGAKGSDIIVLPETCRGQNDQSAESLEGPTVARLAGLAARHQTYIVCPIDRKSGDRRFNSAVVLDRRGRIDCVYDKIYPFAEEFKRNPSIEPGDTVTVFQADFGRVGLAICFDVNWPALWQRLSDFGAELVIWPSAYSAGRSLAARAVDFNYYIMSATWTPDCLVYDLDGEQLLYDRANTADGANVSRFTFDLDRCLFHQDFNYPGKLETLLREQGDQVEREKWLPMEGWFVLRATRPGVRVRDLARLYGLEERRSYLNRSQHETDRLRVASR